MYYVCAQPSYKKVISNNKKTIGSKLVLKQRAKLELSNGKWRLQQIMHKMEIGNHHSCVSLIPGVNSALHSDT